MQTQDADNTRRLAVVGQGFAPSNPKPNRDDNWGTYKRVHSTSLAEAAERFVRDGWPDRESQRAESRLVANNPFRVIDVGSQAYYELARQWNDLPCPACDHRPHTGPCLNECDDDARFTCACGADGGAW